MSISFTQIYTNYAEPFPVYGKTICIIDVAKTGPELQPYKVSLDSEAAKAFGHDSNLVKSLYIARKSGAVSIWLVRINPKINDNGSSYDSQDMYSCLAKAYKVIEDLPIHIVVPTCVYFDDTDNDYALQLARHCYLSSIEYSQRVGIIGVTPIDRELIDSHLSEGEKEKNIKDYTNSLINNKKIKKGFFSEDENEIGYLISIVVSEAYFGGDSLNTYTANGAAAYAGLLSSLSPSTSPKNKPLPAIVDLIYELPQYHVEDFEFRNDIPEAITLDLFKTPERPVVISNQESKEDYSEGIDYIINYENKQIEWKNFPKENKVKASIVYNINDHKELSDAGYIVFSRKPRFGIVPESGVVPSSLSTFKSVQSVRTVQSIIYTIKHAAMDFAIGETEARIAIFEEWIGKYLLYLLETEEIYDCQFFLERTSQEEIKIVLDLVLFSEVSSISTEISVRGAFV